MTSRCHPALITWFTKSQIANCQMQSTSNRLQSSRPFIIIFFNYPIKPTDVNKTSHGASTEPFIEKPHNNMCKIYKQMTDINNGAKTQIVLKEVTMDANEAARVVNCFSLGFSSHLLFRLLLLFLGIFVWWRITFDCTLIDCRFCSAVQVRTVCNQILWNAGTLQQGRTKMDWTMIECQSNALLVI